MPEKKSAKPAKPAAKDQAAAARRTTRTAAKKAANPAAGVWHQEEMRERVQRRAYELWEIEGRPAGREHDHWLRAEREITVAQHPQLG